jgi:hypothetical protein
VGIGAPKLLSNLKQFRFLLLQILLEIRQEQKTPMSWHKSRVFSLYKKDPSTAENAFDVQRSIHSLDPFGKSYYKYIWDDSCHPKELPFEYGYVKHRKRETAILQQLIMRWRLRANHISHVDVSHDMTNAFASPTFESFDDIIEEDSKPHNVEILKQRVHNATMCV